MLLFVHFCYTLEIEFTEKSTWHDYCLRYHQTSISYISFKGLEKFPYSPCPSLLLISSHQHEERHCIKRTSPAVGEVQIRGFVPMFPSECYLIWQDNCILFQTCYLCTPCRSRMNMGSHHKIQCNQWKKHLKDVQEGHEGPYILR